MAGEAPQKAALAPDGVIGDRLWGVVDTADEKIASPGREKRFVRVPQGFARWSETDGVSVSADGAAWAAPDDAATVGLLSERFGFPVRLKSFVERGAAGFRPRYEHAPVHLLTTAALRSLARELPGAVIDARRFRPNIVVDWPDEAEAVPEHGWIGRELRIGDVVLRASEPCARCGFVTIEQPGLPLDVEVLRTIVKRYGRNFGIYCEVVRGGEIGLGHEVVRPT